MNEGTRRELQTKQMVSNKVLYQIIKFFIKFAEISIFLSLFWYELRVFKFLKISFWWLEIATVFRCLCHFFIVTHLVVIEDKLEGANFLVAFCIICLPFLWNCQIVYMLYGMIFWLWLRFLWIFQTNPFLGASDDNVMKIRFFDLHMRFSGIAFYSWNFYFKLSNFINYNSIKTLLHTNNDVGTFNSKFFFKFFIVT